MASETLYSGRLCALRPVGRCGWGTRLSLYSALLESSPWGTLSLSVCLSVCLSLRASCLQIVFLTGKNENNRRRSEGSLLF